MNYFIYLFFAVLAGLGTSQDVKEKSTTQIEWLCANKECSDPISTAKTTGNYVPDFEGKVKLERDKIVNVYRKSVNDHINLWEIKVDGQRGYAPRNFLREHHIKVRNVVNVVGEIDLKVLGKGPGGPLPGSRDTTGQEPALASDLQNQGSSSPIGNLASDSKVMEERSTTPPPVLGIEDNSTAAEHLNNSSSVNMIPDSGSNETKPEVAFVNSYNTTEVSTKNIELESSIKETEMRSAAAHSGDIAMGDNVTKSTPPGSPQDHPMTNGEEFIENDTNLTTLSQGGKQNGQDEVRSKEQQDLISGSNAEQIQSQEAEPSPENSSITEKNLSGSSSKNDMQVGSNIYPEHYEQTREGPTASLEQPASSDEKINTSSYGAVPIQSYVAAVSFGSSNTTDENLSGSSSKDAELTKKMVPTYHVSETDIPTTSSNMANPKNLGQTREGTANNFEKPVPSDAKTNSLVSDAVPVQTHNTALRTEGSNVNEKNVSHLSPDGVELNKEEVVSTAHGLDTDTPATFGRANPENSGQTVPNGANKMTSYLGTATNQNPGAPMPSFEQETNVATNFRNTDSVGGNNQASSPQAEVLQRGSSFHHQGDYVTTSGKQRTLEAESGASSSPSANTERGILEKKYLMEGESSRGYPEDEKKGLLDKNPVPFSQDTVESGSPSMTPQSVKATSEDDKENVSHSSEISESSDSNSRQVMDGSSKQGEILLSDKESTPQNDQGFEDSMKMGKQDLNLKTLSTQDIITREQANYDPDGVDAQVMAPISKDTTVGVDPATVNSDKGFNIEMKPTDQQLTDFVADEDSHKDSFDMHPPGGLELNYWFSSISSVISTCKELFFTSDAIHLSQDPPEGSAGSIDMMKSEPNSKFTDEDLKLEGNCENEDICPKDNPIKEEQVGDETLQFGQGFLLNTGIENLSLQSIALLVVTAVTVLVFTLGFSYLENSNRNSILIAKINTLESKLFLSQKEQATSDEQLLKTNDQVAFLTSEIAKKDAYANKLQEEIKEAKGKHSVLEDTISRQEKEMETLMENSLEMHRLLSETITDEDRSHILLSNIMELKESLAQRLAENIGLSEQLDMRNQEIQLLQLDVKTSSDKQHELEQKLSNAYSNLEDRVLKATEPLKEQIINLEQSIAEKTSDCAQLEAELAGVRGKCDKLTARCDVLEKGLREAHGVRSSDAFATWTEATQVRSHLGEAHAQLRALESKLQETTATAHDLEGQVEGTRQEMGMLNDKYEKAERKKIEALTQLQVLSNYFKEKETQLQEELGTKEAQWLQKQSEGDTIYEQMRALREENMSYRTQNEMLKKEIIDQEAALKKQITTEELKAHEHWVALRQSERRLKEVQMEATQLRNRFTALASSANHSGDGQLSPNGLEPNGESPYPPSGGAVSPPFMLPPHQPPGMFPRNFLPPPPQGQPPPPGVGSTPSRLPPLGRISSPPLVMPVDFTPPPPLMPYELFPPRQPPPPPTSLHQSGGSGGISPPPQLHHRHKPQPTRDPKREQKESMSSNYSTESVNDKPPGRRGKR